MKKLYLFIWALFALQFSHAQWEPDVRLSFSSDSSLTTRNYSHAIAAIGDTVHVTWMDKVDGNFEIFYDRSLDGGDTWDPVTRITNDPASSLNPALAVSDGIVHLVWNDDRDGNLEEYYTRSTDGGTTWDEETRLTWDEYFSGTPVIAVNSSYIHVAWTFWDQENQIIQIYYINSADGGNSWGNVLSINENAIHAQCPSINVDGSNVHITWQDYREGSAKIYYIKSTDNGISWEPEIRLTNDSSSSVMASIAVSGSSVNVAWMDDRNGLFVIYFKESVDGGETWGEDTPITSVNSASVYPNLTLYDGVLYLVWGNNKSGFDDVFFSYSIDNGMTWADEKKLNDYSFSSRYTHIAVSPPALHVVWYDRRDFNYEIYYKRNPTGCIITTIYEGKNKNSAIIFPNPNNGNFKINFQDLKKGNLTVRILNPTGQLVYVKSCKIISGNYSEEVNINEIPAGIYFAQLEQQLIITVNKIIIQK